VDYLQKAGKLGHLVVGVMSDESCDRRIIMSERERAKIILAIKGVAEVRIVDSVIEELKKLKPLVYVKGGDYNIETINQEERRFVESYGGEIKLIPVVEDIHSSKWKK